VKSWFFIDFVSVFPFTLIIKEGVAAKLLRLFRMPKLLKLLDKRKIKGLMSQSMGSGKTSTQ
jgi:hypothetical protein